MPNADRILRSVEAEPGLSDAELVERTGIHPHQQVNQLCRRLERDGLIRRNLRPDGRLGNYPAAVPATAHEPQAPAAPPSELAIPTGTLLVVACSGRKAPDGHPSPRGPSILDAIAGPLAAELARARRDTAATAHLDDGAFLPAWRRYIGTFYTRADRALARCVAARAHLLILSGAYGVLLADEPIGSYERTFHPGDWPHRLAARCVADYCRRHALSHLVAFLGQRTAYAAALRGFPWRESGLASAHIVSSVLGGAGGAQQHTPRALAEAFAAYVEGALDAASWRSSAGFALELESLD